MIKTKVLITNGENLRTLVFLKALKENKNFEVHVASSNTFSATAFSKYCTNKVRVHPTSQKNLFIDDLLKYIKNNKINILIPINVNEIEVVLEKRSLFEKYVNIPYVSLEMFNKVNDKWEFYKILKKLKVRTPHTIKIKDLSEIEKIKRVLKYPVIVKLRVSSGSKGVVLVNKKEDLLQAYNKLLSVNSDRKQELPIIQEYIAGESYGAGAFRGKYSSIKVLVYKNLREYYITYGTSTSRISVIDKEITSAVKKILAFLKWEGVAQFDIIKNTTGTYLIEMNPRFWTSLNVSIKSGVNFPEYLCRFKDDLKNQSASKSGVTCKVFMPDTVVFFKSIFSKKKPYPLLEYLNFYKKNVFLDDIDFTDPMPSIPLLIMTIRNCIL